MIFHRTRLGFGLMSFLPLFWAFLGCGNSTGESSGAGGGAAVTSGTGASGMGGAGTTTGAPTSSSPSSSTGSGDGCPAPEPAHAGVKDMVGNVTATIFGIDGKPAPSLLADVCGTNLCLSGKTDAGGQMSVMGGGKELSDVRLLYGNGMAYVKMGTPLSSLPDAAFGMIHTVLLPPVAEGVALEAGKVATSGEVSVAIAVGAYIGIDATIYKPGEDGFRAVVFAPSDGTFPAVAAAPKEFARLVGMAPINARFCPPAKLTVPNEDGWVAGAAVEVWLNGTETFDHFAPFGGWAIVAGATVSADGASIVTNDGEGLPELGVIGLRLK
ncbi:MAG: hypothetical protein EXR75_06230 [Myxococcales bacterium]|nr:hypothetical protein [Myxococcales bacterium]